jgi:release factor glutamine methyltransferase
VPVTWRQLLHEAAARLGDDLEARRLVEAASGAEGAEFVEALGAEPLERQVTHFRAMTDRRAAGEPLQYVLGAGAIRTLDLIVDRRVLIPRPETEQVVEVAIRELRAMVARRTVPDDERVLVADLGTGSGAIALSIAVELPRAEVWASDAVADALAVARANLAGAGTRAAGRVHLVEGEWYEALPPELRGRLHAIVSNPPYVGAGEELPSEVGDWEPATALVAGPRGDEAIEVIVSGARDWLVPGGVLVVELAPHQAESAAAMCRDAGLVDVAVHPDLTGRPRAMVAGSPARL